MTNEPAGYLTLAFHYNSVKSILQFFKISSKEDLIELENELGCKPDAVFIIPLSQNHTDNIMNGYTDGIIELLKDILKNIYMKNTKNLKPKHSCMNIIRDKVQFFSRKI